jgi:hypothetical protein
VRAASIAIILSEIYQAKCIATSREKREREERERREKSMTQHSLSIDAVEAHAS